MLRLKGVILACCHVSVVPAIFNDWQRRRRITSEPFAGRISVYALRDRALAAMYPRGTRNWFWNRLRFHVRTRRGRAETRLWLEWLAEADLRPLWEARPRLMLKVHRPYLRNDWNGFDRLKALIAHYHVLREIFSPGRRRQIFQQGLTLLQIDADGPTPFSFSGLVVSLAYLDQFEKEGELTLQVRDRASGLGLAQLSFCFGVENGRRVMRIGGIQAKGDPRTRELINAAAKLCHGLRPKALAVWCLRELAHDWRVVKIYAVDDATQVCRRRAGPGLAASYDEFWAECGGARQPDGQWVLPLEVLRRSRAELRPCRRKEHERRYAMLDAWRPRLRAALEPAEADAAEAA